MMDENEQIRSDINMGNINQATKGLKSKGSYNRTRPNNLSLQFKKVRSRREFFDMIKDYIYSKGSVGLMEIDSYIQYTTGASGATVRQSLAILENLNLVKSEESKNRFDDWEIMYSPADSDNIPSVIGDGDARVKTLLSQETTEDNLLELELTKNTTINPTIEINNESLEENCSCTLLEMCKYHRDKIQ